MGSAPLSSSVRCSLRWLFVATLLLTSPAWSKCAAHIYTVSGSATTADGAALGGMTITARWNEFDGSKAIDAMSNADGTYSLRIPYYPFVHLYADGEHDCSAMLRQVELVATSKGVKERKILVVDGRTAKVDFLVTPVSSGAPNKSLERSRAR